MRKLIDGKLYDTDKGKLLATKDFGNDAKEYLQRGINGSFFVYSVVKSTSGIYPMSETDVLRWLGEYDFIDVAEQLFPGRISEA